MCVCVSALIPLECLLPSLNASSPLECLFKPEGRAWAAGGGPEASYTKFKIAFFTITFLTSFSFLFYI